MLIFFVLSFCIIPNLGARIPKSIFSVVKFSNDACDATDNSYNGTCLTSNECTAIGGTASGTCAEGFGVCCTLTIGCGSTSSTNNTYLVQTSTKDSASCSYTICPSSTDVCKLRIDFETFKSTAAATSDGIRGNCAEDTLTISNPTGASVPVMCGTLTGQHMYVDSSSSCNTINSIISSGDTSTSREWNIKVTQIECTNALLPPSGCLQYFTGTTGYLYNFGWVAATTTTAKSSTYHLNNQDYTMCIRREEGYCSMEYFAEKDSGFGVSDGEPNSPAAAFGEANCPTDYLIIPGLLPSGSTATTDFAAISQSRICGDNWTASPNAAGAAAATFVTFTKPWTVSVHFDEAEATTANKEHSNGFAILYTQKTC